MSVILENKETNTIIKAPVGISWTVLIATIFFGNASTVAFFRKDYKGAAILLIPFFIMLLLNYFTDTTKLSLSWAVYVIYLLLYIAWLAFFVFVYNRIYIRGLLTKGYKMIHIPENYDRYNESDFVPSDKSEEEITKILQESSKRNQIALTIIFIVLQIFITIIYSLAKKNMG